MKTLLSILALLAATALPGAPEIPKLAIVGEKNCSELLHVELGNAAGFELYERDQIRPVLAELQLKPVSAAELMKRFPHVDCFAVLEPLDRTPERLIVFDARSGYRKADVVLPPALEDAVKRAAETITRTMKLSSLERVAIGISSLRDSGVPERFNRISDFAAVFEQLAIEDESIILLERSRLGYVAQEREITETAFPLAPSSKLVRMEFTPGNQPEIVHCTVRITDNTGKVLSKAEFSNVFADIPGSGGEVFRAVKGFTVQSSAPFKTEAHANRVEEAARFFAEFKNAHDPVEAESKLMAARALAPQNRDYINAEILLRFKSIDPIQDSTRRLDAWREAIDCAKRLDLAPCLEPCLSLMSRTNIIHNFQWNAVKTPDRRASLPPNEEKEAEKIAAEYRTLLDDAFRGSPQTQTFRDYTALNRLLSTIHGIYGNPALHLSQESYRKSSAVELGLLFDVIESHIKADPKIGTEGVDLNGYAFRFLSNDDRWQYHPEGFYDFIERAAQSPAATIRLAGLHWQLLKDLHEADAKGTRNFDAIARDFEERVAAFPVRNYEYPKLYQVRLKTIKPRDLESLFAKYRQRRVPAPDLRRFPGAPSSAGPSSSAPVKRAPSRPAPSTAP